MVPRIDQLISAVSSLETAILEVTSSLDAKLDNAHIEAFRDMGQFTTAPALLTELLEAWRATREASDSALKTVGDGLEHLRSLMAASGDVELENIATLFFTGTRPEVLGAHQGTMICAMDSVEGQTTISGYRNALEAVAKTSSAYLEHLTTCELIAVGDEMLAEHKRVTITSALTTPLTALNREVTRQLAAL
jgi:hypothetical protein